MPQKGLFATLRLRDFRRVWTAEVISDAGSFVTFIALAVYVHDLTGKTFAVGLALALRTIPWVLIGPIGGVIADRMDRRTVMISCDLIRAVLVATLPFTHAAWQAYVLSFASGLFSPLFRPARQALLPTIAPGENYVRALALSEVSHQVLHTIGPALGGAAVLAVGARHAFFLDALSFLVSASFLVGVRTRGASRRPRTVGEVTSELGDGIRIMRRDRLVSRLVLARGVVLFGVGDGFTALLLVYLSGRGLGAGAYGVALAVAGLGTAVGTSVLARRHAGAPRTVPLVISGVAPLLLLLFVFRPEFAVLLAVLVALGGAGAGMALYLNASIAERMPDEARGRIFSLTGAVYEACELAGALMLTAVGSRIGSARGIVGGGALTAIAAAIVVIPTVTLMRASDRERAVLSSPHAPVSDPE
ncbi:MAG: MFS transporter [Actinomycetota bacterium]|nr:MFS transporter [Actinomycetota bacterium]